jgi:hypothetical protein
LNALSNVAGSGGIWAWGFVFLTGETFFAPFNCPLEAAFEAIFEPMLNPGAGTVKGVGSDADDAASTGLSTNEPAARSISGVGTDMVAEAVPGVGAVVGAGVGTPPATPVKKRCVIGVLLGAAEMGESEATVLSLLVRSISTASDCGVTGVAGPMGDENCAAAQESAELNGPLAVTDDDCDWGGGACNG